MGVDVRQQEAVPHSLGGRTTRETLLTVTASPDAQDVIGNLIGLMLESKPRASDIPTPTEATTFYTDPTDDPTAINATENGSSPLRSRPSTDPYVTE